MKKADFVKSEIEKYTTNYINCMFRKHKKQLSFFENDIKIIGVDKKTITRCKNYIKADAMRYAIKKYYQNRLAKQGKKE